MKEEGGLATNISTHMGAKGQRNIASRASFSFSDLIHMQTEDRHRRSFNVVRASFMLVHSPPEDFTSVTYPTNGHFPSYLEKRLPLPLSLSPLNAPKRKSLHFSMFPNAAQWIPRALTTKTALSFSSSFGPFLSPQNSISLYFSFCCSGFIQRAEGPTYLALMVRKENTH